jgi:hypothetical protein
MPKSERAGRELDDKKQSPWNRFWNSGQADELIAAFVFYFAHARKVTAHFKWSGTGVALHHSQRNDMKAY